MIIIAKFVCDPVMEHAADKVPDSLDITGFWEESGVYDLIDSMFGDTGKSILPFTLPFAFATPIKLHFEVCSKYFPMWR